MRFGVMGLNFKSAKIEERETIARAFDHLFGKRSRHNTVLLSTCNRSEIYFYDPDPAKLHTQFLKEMRMTLACEFDHNLYSYFDQECLAHLSKVTAGFDSAFLGESEIQHQVKCAYSQAANQKKLPSDLHYLFQKSLHNGKVLRSKLCLDQKMPTLSKVIANQVGKKRILVVGNSKIGRQCILALKRSGANDITVATRYPEDIKEKLLPWNQLFLWPTFDIVIATSKTDTPILLKADYFENAPIQKIYDLGLPRNTEDLPITVCDIDQLGQIVQKMRLNQTKYVKIGEEKIREIVSRQFGLAKQREKRAVI